MFTFNGLSMSAEAYGIACAINGQTGLANLYDGYNIAAVKGALRQLYVATGGKRGPTLGFDPTTAQLRSIYNGETTGAAIYAAHCGQPVPTVEAAETVPVTAPAAVDAPLVTDDVPTDDTLKALQTLLAGQKVNPEAVKRMATDAVDGRVGEVLASMAALVAAEVARAVRKVEIKVGAMPAVTVSQAHRQLEKVLLFCVAKRNVMLKGPAGCGKTKMAEQIAEILQVNYYFSGKCVDEAKLLGYMDAGGTYRGTAFRLAWEFGGVFLADEMDAWAPEALIALNAPLAGQFCDFPDGIITRHADTVILAAVNTNGTGADRDYSAREVLDGASLNRFAFFEIEYDENLELAIAPNDDWTRHVQKHRAAVVKLGKATRGVLITPRDSIDGGHMLANGLAWAEAEEAYIWRGMAEEKRNLIKAELR